MEKAEAGNKNSTGNESQSAVDPSLEGESTVAENPCCRPTGHTRRQMAKSEPSRVNESTDGGHDSDVTAVSSGEGQPLSHGPAMVISINEMKGCRTNYK